MIKGILLTILMLTGFTTVAENFPVKPNPAMTQGDYCNPRDPDFVDYRYNEKVPYCVRNVSYALKKEIYEVYRVPAKCRREYTVDHYVPLFMGGSNHEGNLWPEHKNVKATRQNLEMELYIELKNGRMTQAQALQIITDAKMHPPKVEPSKCHIDNMVPPNMMPAGQPGEAVLQDVNFAAEDQNADHE